MRIQFAKNVLLVGVDFQEVNIALGKLSTYHKNLGNNVTLKHLGFDGYPKKKIVKVDATDYDLVYVSQLFDTNTGKYEILNCEDVIIGGVGSPFIDRKLPEEVEHLEVDYSLFDTDCSVGYLTKECIRKCYFCKVHKHEGYIHLYAEIDEVLRHKKLKLLDNNILSYPDHMRILQELVDRQILVQFNQGFDIRLINAENAELISKLNTFGEIIFAFDDVKDLKAINEKLAIVKRFIPKPWKLKFYIYHNAKFTPIKDTIFRVEWCRNNEVLPYLMRDVNCWESEESNFMIDYAAYCNQPSFFKKIHFDDFLDKRHDNFERIDESQRTYYKHRI